MTHEETKQAIAGFTEFFKGITGNQDMKIPNDLAKQYGIEQEPTETWSIKDVADIFERHGIITEQEPSGDLISRQAAIDVIEKWLECSDYNEAERHIMRATESILYDLPSVNQQEPCEDAISRQALLDAFGFSEKTRKWGGDHSGYNTMMLYEIQDMIESAPPVNPQEKTGHWITKIKSDLRGDMWPTNPKCSECGGEPYYSNTIYNYKFCPYCGAKMIEPQERSE